MPSTYSPNLAIQLIATGDQAGQWGLSTNTNLGTLIESAISGFVTQAFADGNITLPMPLGADGGNGSTANPVAARNMFITCSGTNTAVRNLYVPTNTKLYFISNQTTGGFGINVTTVGGTGIIVPSGATALLVCNGVNVINAFNYLPTLSSPVVIPAPGSGSALTVYGVATGANPAVSIQGAANSIALVTLQGGINLSQGSFIGAGVAEIISTTSTGLYMGTNQAVPVAICTQSISRIGISGTGNVSIASPTSALALTVYAASGQYGIQVSGANTATYAGIQLVAGGATAGTSDMFMFQNITTFDGYLGMRSPSILHIQTNSADRITVSGAGNVTIAAPTNGAALKINNVAGGTGINVTGTTGSGLSILNGTSNSNFNSIFQDSTGTTNFMLVYGDGGVTVGTPTSGDLGLGSLNATGLYVNGQSVVGIPQNSQSGTTYTLALSDNGKHIYGTNTSAKTVTIPANSSVAFPIGAAVTFINGPTGVMSIAITTDTMILANSPTTGTRTLAVSGVATAVKIAATTWIISGTGLA
jgi:hypothetical protein